MWSNIADMIVNAGRPLIIIWENYRWIIIIGGMIAIIYLGSKVTLG